MGIQNYGVWKATPTSFKVQRAREDPNSPHGYLVFTDGISTLPKLEAAINVKSISEDSRLVFWHTENFNRSICNQLEDLAKGWHDIPPNTGNDPNRISLDLIRDGLVILKDGVVVPHDVEGEKNDIIDFIEPFFQNAIQKKATVYIWGEQYDDKDGVHDVHMNQGSSGRFAAQNGPNQDGGVVLQFEDGHWEAFFIAFASQTFQTTSTGQPKGDTFAVFLGAPPETGGSTGEEPSPPTKPRPNGSVRIAAALVNPEGHDNIDNPEILYLKNTTDIEINLGGWRVENHRGDATILPASAIIAASGEEEGFELPGLALSNKGGSIILKDADNKIVDKVSYTKAQASQAGQVIRFE